MACDQALGHAKETMQSLASGTFRQLSPAVREHLTPLKRNLSDRLNVHMIFVFISKPFISYLCFLE